MLTLYVFLIFALGSSVIAIPPRYNQAYGVPELWKDTRDKRLQAGIWGRLVKVKLQPGQTPTWADASDCDDFINFVGGSRFIGTMKIYRVVRELRRSKDKFTYMVARSTYGDKPSPGWLREVYHAVPASKWKTFLDKTFWGRAPNIVGEVSDGVMI